jgi:hypothetical protein
VRARIAGDCSVRPHVFPHQLTGNHYRDFLLHDLPKLLEDVPLVVRARMWYMHDGASAHFSSAVRDVLSNKCHDPRIGRGGPTAWPPRSPNLNPLNFYLWGHLKFKCTLSTITHKLNVSGHILIWTFFLLLICGTHAQSLSAPFSYTLYTGSADEQAKQITCKLLACLTFRC